MLKLLIERAGYQTLIEQAACEESEKLAIVPAELAHCSLDAFLERPVQAELVNNLVLSVDHERFTSCVLVHGMGGTGKVSGLPR